MSETATSETTTLARPADAETEYFDVLIVGAGISGIGGAYHLTQQCPGTSFVVLEAQDSYGGTWWTHRYPGIRSDSDLHTFGFRFKPWTSAPIATAAEILSYMGAVIEENRLAPHIRYHHKIATASWSSDDNLWTIEATRSDTGEARTFTANFLWMCQGYYRHRTAVTRRNGTAWTRFKGHDRSPAGTWPERHWTTQGRNVCRDRVRAPPPPHWSPRWPQDVAHMSRCCSAHLRFSAPAAMPSRLAEELRVLQESRKTWIHEIVRRKILYEQDVFTRRSFNEPDKVRRRTAWRLVKAELPPRLRRRYPLHPVLSALAPAHRVRAGRRPVQGNRIRQGLRRHR